MALNSNGPTSTANGIVRDRGDSGMALTLALEINVGLDKAGDESARQRLQPVVATDVRRQRAHDVLEQMLFAIDRRRHAVVAVEHLQRQIQAKETSDQGTAEREREREREREERRDISSGEGGRGGRYVRRKLRTPMRGPRGRGGSRA
jgi:hypothetical protein